MSTYYTNVGPYAELDATEAEACGRLDFLFEQRREWHQQQPEHATQLAELPKDDDYGNFFSILQAIADGVPGFTVDDLSFSDAMESTISCEIDRWRRNPPVMREYARVFCRVQNYHEMQDPSHIAYEILESSKLGQLTATSFRCAALELMIYGKVLHEERDLSEVFNILVEYDPNIVATINTAFDNFLDKNIRAYEQNFAYNTGEDDAIALGSVAEVASSLWGEGLYTSPYAFALILRIVFEWGPALERDFVDEGASILTNHAMDIREIIVRGDFLWHNLHSPRERARYAIGPDTAIHDHLPGSPGGLSEGRWRYWIRSLEGLDQRAWDNEDPEDKIDIGDVLRVTGDAENAFPVCEYLVPQTFANHVTSMEW